MTEKHSNIIPFPKEKPKMKLMFIEFTEPEYHGPRKNRDEDKRFKRNRKKK